MDNVTTANASHEYCGEWWENFLAPHRSMYVYVITFMCCLGCLTNILNLIIFTRKSMVVTPIHKILAALAATDLLLMILGVEEFVYHRILELYGMKEGPESYAKVVVFLLHEVFFVLFHTWSIYLTLTIAIWRYIAVFHPSAWLRWGGGNGRSEKFAIFAALTTGIILTLPYTAAIIRPKDGGEQNENFVPENHHLEYQVDWEKWQGDARDWINAILIKILPCILIIVVIIRLSLALRKGKRDRKKLQMAVSTVGTSMENLNGKSGDEEQQVQEKNKQEKNLNSNTLTAQMEFDKMTQMLLLILAIFVQTEFPPGLFSLLSAILGMKFRMECEWPALGMLNMQAYISGAINFFAYLIYSARFRQLFLQGLRHSMPTGLRLYLSNFRGCGWCLADRFEGENGPATTTLVVSS